MSLTNDLTPPVSETDVLRAMLRLARRRTPPTLEQLLVRVGGDEGDVQRVLRSLERSSLVQRTPAGLRLSLPGFAVALACAERARQERAASRASGVKVAPLARRRRAA